MLPEYLLAQQTTIAAASTAETTIISADAACRNDLVGLVITSTNAAAATLTIKDGTGGTTKMILNYPASAAVVVAPVEIYFPKPVKAAAKNANWTATASANANGINITALYSKSE